MIQSKKRYLIFFSAAILFSGLFLGGYFDSLASVNYGSTTGSCDMMGTSGGCSFSVGVGDHQGYAGDVYGVADGGGVVGMSACLNTDGVMWSGECYTICDSIIGANTSCGQTLSNYDPNHGNKYITAEVYANDATWEFVSVDLNGRRISIDSLSSNNYDVPVGSSFTVSWDVDQALIPPVVLTWVDWDNSGIVLAEGNDSVIVSEDGSSSFTCANPGSVTIALSARGPTGYGPYTENSGVVVNCVQSAPGAFNLSSSACYGGPDANGNGYFDLSWSSSANATNYDIYAHAWSSGAWGLIGNTTGLSFTAIQPAGTDWYFKVVAKNSAGSTDSTPNNLFGGNCPFPTADIKAAPPGGSSSDGPITISYNTSAILSWTSQNTTSCSLYVDDIFTGWTGTNQSNVNTGNLTSNHTYKLICSNAFGNSVQDIVQVNVGPAPRTLTVSKAGNGSGTVTSSPAGINCGSDCSETYNDGTNVVLTASPATGSTFSGWSGDCSGTGDCSFLPITSNKSVTATFIQQPPTVTTNPATNILTTSATLNGQANPNAASATGWFRYSTSSPGSCNDSFGTRVPSSGGTGLGSGTSNVAYSQSISGLSPNTLYYFCAIASNSGGTGFGSVVSFTTAVLAPTVDLKCNGAETCGTVNYGESRTLSWSITNGMPATSCEASSNGWSGSKSTSGSEGTGAINSDKTWTIQCTGPGGTGPADSVSATVPAPEADIRCDDSNGPCNLIWGASSFIEWCGNNAHTCSDSSSCSVTKNGSSWASGTSGGQSTGAQTAPGTYTFSLSCSGNGSSSDSIQIIVANPIPNDPNNVNTTAPNYCVSGPAATITWSYSDPSGSPQSAYEVEMDEQGSFQDSEYKTGKFLTNSTSNFTGQGILQFGKTYKTRVRVWNSYDQVSGWTVQSGNFNTPPYAYPQVDFYWTANGIQNNPSPPLNKPVTFTDTTVFNGNPNGREWDWLFGDGGTSTTQNPSHTYVAEGSYYVTLTATDNANQSCVRTKGPLIIQKPIPKWREIAPR